MYAGRTAGDRQANAAPGLFCVVAAVLFGGIAPLSAKPGTWAVDAIRFLSVTLPTRIGVKSFANSYIALFLPL
jgi:hypothetical protein